MKTQNQVFVAVLMLMTARPSIYFSTLGQSNPGKDLKPIIGIWRAQMNGLPAITLTISEESGGLSGAALFLSIRQEEGSKAVSQPGIPEPVFDLQFDGRS